ncbi:YEATS-associated helix-containing protein [Hoeflea sp. TYP-13]|uniref:YEATS-associated helix-containing protein n=1 Tax=Hoeflea sp. TYP-13 TaxID=3230023 RepID=UPI0034C5FFCD
MSEIASNAGNIGANLALLVLVMLLAGLLGGTVNYFLRVPEKNAEDSEGWWKRFRGNRLLHQCLLMGIAASFVIPVFLQIAALGVDKNILTNFLINAGNSHSLEDLAQAYTSLALIGGFCVLAAISSPTFLQNLSAKILQQAQQASTEAKQARSEAEAAQQRTQLLEKAREPEIDARLEALRNELTQGQGVPEDPDDDAPAGEEPTAEEKAAEQMAEEAQKNADSVHGFRLSELDRLILQALAAKPNTRRSVKGIRTDTILKSSQNHANETYSSVRGRLYRLASAGYVRKLENADGGLPRWKLGTKGWAELK